MKPIQNPKYLMIYLEPTPYIISLIKKIIRQLKGKGTVDVLFVNQNISQKWDLSLKDIPAKILPRKLFSCFNELYRTIIKGRYNVIHIAGWGNSYSLFSLLIAKQHKIPVVMESDSHLHNSPTWKKTIKSIFYPLLFSLPQMMLPVGIRQAEYLRYYGIKENKIKIVNMTVDVNHIIKQCSKLGRSGRNKIRKKLGFLNKDIVYLFVGRLVNHKGIEDLISAFNIISRKHKNTKLLIIGDGSKKEFVKKQGKENRKIKYLGRLNQEEIIKIYHASDIFVLPSHFEPWGLVINEALASKLPVIVTEAVGCVDDLVKNNKTGIVVKTKNIKELANAMQTLHQNPTKRKQMGKQGKKLISKWTLENEAQKIIQVWNKVGNHLN